jgi:hypothetical protein
MFATCPALRHGSGSSSHLDCIEEIKVETTGGIHVSTSEALSKPMARGWYQCPDDPQGVQRWFNGASWTHRTTGRLSGEAMPTPHGPSTTPLADATSTGPRTPELQQSLLIPPALVPQVPPPAGRGWNEYPGDPQGVQRWYDGTQWTNRLTGGTAADQAGAVRLPGSVASRSSALTARGPVAPTAQGGFIPMMYNPATGESAFVDPATGTLHVRPRYSDGRRVGYTILWSFYAFILAIGGLTSLTHDQIMAGLVAAALAVLAGRYAMRIWTYRARTLWLLLFF